MNSKNTEELKLADEMGAEEVEKVIPRFLACVEDSGGRQGLEMRYSSTPESDFGNICEKGCFYSSKISFRINELTVHQLTVSESQT